MTETQLWIQLSFLNKCFLGCYKALGNFQCSSKVGSDDFCHLFYCFYERTNFWNFLLYICTDVASEPFLFVLHIIFPYKSPFQGRISQTHIHIHNWNLDSMISKFSNSMITLFSLIGRLPIQLQISLVLEFWLLVFGGVLLVFHYI